MKSEPGLGPAPQAPSTACIRPNPTSYEEPESLAHTDSHGMLRIAEKEHPLGDRDASQVGASYAPTRVAPLGSLHATWILQTSERM